MWSADAVDARALVQHRDSRQVPEEDSGHTSHQCRRADPDEVRRRDVRGSEADALEHADPVVLGDHRGAHHVSDDQHGHCDTDQGEGHDERLDNRRVAGRLSF
jgi:hypothetical protein